LKLGPFCPEFDVKLERLRAESNRWMVVVWVGTVAMTFFAGSIDQAKSSNSSSPLMLITYFESSGIFPPPPGASITTCRW
jgi:hypothetical protein